jgi:1-acyl-sn-glycerol-3-phosphate acyltransferase
MVCLAAPFSTRAAYAAARGWCRLMLTLCRILCGLGFEVRGQEHIPAQPAVVLLKHSSAWETMATLAIFPWQTWVLKRELLWIPIIGWAMWAMKAIVINRSLGRSAVRQVLRQGKDSLASGRCVVIFPEGTRMPPGTTRPYGVSGALLASRTGCPIIPVAHNAGDFWPRRGLLKRPGTISVVIGPPLETTDRTPQQINEQAQRWVEKTMRTISSAYPTAPVSPDPVGPPIA